MEIENRKYTVMDYIKIPLKISPIAAIFIVILRIVVATIPSLQVLATSSFVDTAIDIFNNGNTSKIYMPLLLIMLCVSFSWLSSIFLSFIKQKLNLKVNEDLDTAVLKKRCRLAYEHVEDNDTWDLISRVGDGTSEKIMGGFDNLLNIVDYIIRIASLMLIIITQVWWVALAITALTLPLFSLSIKSGKVTYEAYEESNKYMRKADYLKEVLSSREHVEERALFGYSNAINNMWKDRFETARKIDYKAEKHTFIKLKIGSILIAFLAMSIALVLLPPVKSGAISVGMYMSLVSASFSLVYQMSWQFSLTMQQFSKNKLYLNDFTKFASLKEVKGSDKLPDTTVQNIPFERIEFRNVSFAYPGTSRNILDGLSMVLEKNKQYAFVGINGAGKTTITKLLTGLYDNYEGEILINDKDIRTFTKESLKAYFSVVYQDFAKYEITLKDNILLSRLGQDIDEETGELLVKKSLTDMSMLEEVGKLPQGINTHLGKISEGSVDLSGGQWQRVAIARTLVSSAPLYILDEPTAALDPISESKLYKLFGKVSKGKSSIIITHRLGAARIADEILVVSDGAIAERGSHLELMKKNGIYREMFDAQRSWYDEEAI